VLAADVAAERPGRREDLVPELLQPDQVRRRRVEFEDDRIALAGSQAFRPARLGDGKDLSGRRIRHLAVDRGVSAAEADELGDERRHLVPAGIGVLRLLGNNRQSFKGLNRARRAARAQLAEETVGCLGEQFAAGREEVGITVEAPKGRVLRDPLRSERARVHCLDRAEVLVRLAFPDDQAGFPGEETEVSDGVNLTFPVPDLI
jgi:hypothetical protein